MSSYSNLLFFIDQLLVSKTYAINFPINLLRFIV